MIPNCFPRPTRLAAAAAFALAALSAQANPLSGASLFWTQKHATAPVGFTSEVVSFDSASKTLWVAGVNGVQVLNAIDGAPLSFITLPTGTAIQTEKIVGLGAKNHLLAGNEIDTRSNNSINFQSVAVRGLYQPDGLAPFQFGGQTYFVMANEDDFREDNDDRSNASVYGATGDLAGLLAGELCAGRGAAVDVAVVEAIPALGIVQHAATWPADCVVVGRHGQGLVADALLGSTALDAIHHSGRDVLVVS